MANGTKPGYKTTEFWLTLGAIIVGAVLQDSGIENAHVLKSLTIISSVLAAMGYTFMRTKAKNGQ